MVRRRLIDSSFMTDLGTRQLRRPPSWTDTSFASSATLLIGLRFQAGCPIRLFEIVSCSHRHLKRAPRDYAIHLPFGWRDHHPPYESHHFSSSGPLPAPTYPVIDAFHHFAFVIPSWPLLNVEIVQRSIIFVTPKSSFFKLLQPSGMGVASQHVLLWSWEPLSSSSQD